MASGTRDRILDASLAHFARHGFRGTTVTDLEAAAGLKPGSGSFYRHFRSKDEVFAAVVERELDRVHHANIDNAASKGPIIDVRLTLAVELHRVLDGVRRLGALTAIVGRDGAQLADFSDRLEETVSRGIDVDADLLGRLMDEGLIPRRDPRALAVVVANALVGYHLNTTYFAPATGAVGLDAFVAVLVDLITT